MSEIAVSSDDALLTEMPWRAANMANAHRFRVAPKFDVHAEMVPVPRRDLMRTLFYGNNQSRPEAEFNGLATHYATIDPTKAQCAANVIAHQDDLVAIERTSIWLVCWSERAVFMLSPDGLPALDGGSAGLCIMDWRYAGRLCNIDPRTNLDLKHEMRHLLMRAPTISNTKPIFYINRSIAERFQVDGGFMDEIFGVPVRVTDALRCDEDWVV